MPAPINTADFLHSNLRNLPDIAPVSSRFQAFIDREIWGQSKTCRLDLIRMEIANSYPLDVNHTDGILKPLLERSAIAVTNILNAKVRSVYQGLNTNTQEVLNDFELVPPVVPRDLSKIHTFAYTITPLGVDFFFAFQDGDQISTCVNFLATNWINSTEIIQDNPLQLETPINVQ